MDKEHKTKLAKELEDTPIEHNNIEFENSFSEEPTEMINNISKAGFRIDSAEKLKKIMANNDHSETLTGLTEEMIKKYGIDSNTADELLVNRYKDKFPQSHESLYDMDILNNIELPNFVDIEGIKKPKSPEQPSDGYKGRKPK